MPPKQKNPRKHPDLSNRKNRQATKSSLVFDIRLGGECGDNVVNQHRPLFCSVKIKSFKITPSIGIPMLPKSKNQDEDEFCELYANTWILFQPDVVIDAALGKTEVTDFSVNLLELVCVCVCE